jgi:hypothetical protein
LDPERSYVRNSEAGEDMSIPDKDSKRACTDPTKTESASLSDRQGAAGKRVKRSYRRHLDVLDKTEEGRRAARLKQNKAANARYTAKKANEIQETVSKTELLRNLIESMSKDIHALEQELLSSKVRSHIDVVFLCPIFFRRY